MKSKILVVDDDLEIRRSLHKVLRAEGYEVLLAEDGLVGLDMFDPAQTDLLLLDLNLPGKCGWDVVERITSVSPLLPIIVITGQPNQCEMATAAGVGALMGKPLDVPFLLQTITELLDEPVEQRLERLVGRPNHLRLSPRGLPDEFPTLSPVKSKAK